MNARRALVTGGSVRVGRAICLELARAGMHVGVHYRSSAQEADETCSAIRAMGAKAVALQADLDDGAQARALVEQASQHFGGLDLLVLSAASFERVPLFEIDDAAWDRTIRTNLTSAFVLAQRAAPLLAQSSGSIVAITCSSTQTPFRNHLPYVVAKAGLLQLVRTLALELAPDVRVNAVAPGTVLPPPGMSEEAVRRVTAPVPLGDRGSAEAVAHAVRYLADAEFVTGHEIPVDGGRSLAAVERFESPVRDLSGS